MDPRHVVLALALGACLALVACAEERAMPSELIGAWVSDDPALAGRSLEIARHSIGFREGDEERSRIVVRKVERSGEGGLVARFDVAGQANDGAAVELALELQAQPERLRLETYREPWRRMKDDGGAH